MKIRSVHPRNTPGVSRRELLHAGLAAGAALAAWPLSSPSTLWGGDVGAPRRGGTLRVRGWDPVHSAGRRWMILRMSSPYAKESRGTTSLPSMAASWWSMM